MRSHLVAAVTSGLALVSACTPHAPVIYPQAPPVYYGVSFETSRVTTAGSLPRRSDILAKDAREMLQPGRTVAFLPPDRCDTTSVAPSGATQGTTAIGMNCGALIASLEAEVAKAGYSVVSWQAIKGGGTAQAQERARALGVDILFEVNDLVDGERGAGETRLANLRFTREDGPGQSAPVAVVPAVAQRCGQLLTELAAKDADFLRQPGIEYLSTVNLKAVDVRRGRALWLYQNTVVELMGEQGSVQQTLYFRADGTRPEPPMPEDSGLKKTGGTLFALGLTSLVIGAVVATVSSAESSDDPFAEEEDAGSGASTAIALGAIGAGVGGLMMFVGHQQGAPDRTVPPATYPTPDRVVCAGPAVLDPWKVTGPTVEAAPVAQDSYSFSTTTEAGRDHARELKDRLTRKSTEDFVAALKQVAGR